MPVYFEMRSPSMPLERPNADALAEILQDAVKSFDVRVVSIRPARPNAYLYACAARKKPAPNALVRVFRADKRLRQFDFSSEAETSDGPFAWHQK